MSLYVDEELAILDTGLYEDFPLTVIQFGESEGAKPNQGSDDQEGVGNPPSLGNEQNAVDAPPSPASTIGATPPELAETEGDEDEVQGWREQEKLMDTLIRTPELELELEPEPKPEPKPEPEPEPELELEPKPTQAVQQAPTPVLIQEVLDPLPKAPEKVEVLPPEQAPASDLMALACTAVLSVAAPAVSEVATAAVATTSEISAEATWTCEYCTTVNPETVTKKGGILQQRVKCTVCQKFRAKAADSAATGSSGGSSSSSSNEADVKARRRQVTSMAEAVSTSQAQSILPASAAEEAGGQKMDVSAGEGQGEEDPAGSKTPAAKASHLPPSCPPAPPPTPATPAVDLKPALALRGKRGTKSKDANSSSSSSSSDVPAPPEPTAGRPARKAKSKRVEDQDENHPQGQDQGQGQGEEKEAKAPAKRGKVETRSRKQSTTEENAPNVDASAQEPQPAQEVSRTVTAADEIYVNPPPDWFPFLPPPSDNIYAQASARPADVTAPLRQREAAKAKAAKGKGRAKGKGKAGGAGMDVDVAQPPPPAAAGEDPEGVLENAPGRPSLAQHVRLYGSKHDITLT